MNIQLNKLSNFLISTLCIFSVILLNMVSCQADDEKWKSKITPHLYWQGYNGSDTHNNTVNIGAYLNSEYLDSYKLTIGYYNTNTSLKNNALLSENILHLSGQHDIFLDIMPGKLTLRLDTYFGQSILEYNTANPPGSMSAGGMGNSGKITGGSATIKETANMSSFQPQIGYSNFAKTFYADIGYAYSKYNGTSSTEVKQLTPTVGFFWNDSYDWLQLRAYQINIDDTASAYNKNKFESLEIKYTHWIKDSVLNNIEHLRLSALIGDRILAVDPDARIIYSSADMQTGSIEASVQWKISKTDKILTLVNYSLYTNQASLDDYNSVLLYINYQNQ